MSAQWQIVQPGGFGASLEDELFDELDRREEQQHRNKKTLFSESDSDDESEEEEDEEEEEEGNKQPWTHLCVLDFEACREELSEGKEWVYEITELPVTLLNCSTLKVEDRFHRYCRPERITAAVLQRYVDRKYGDMGQAEAWHAGAVSLQTALHDLERWLREKDLLGDNADAQPARFAFITCGDWDFKNALPRNCDLLGLPVPPFMRQWINVKTVYQQFYKTRRPPAGMTTMLRALDIPLEGTHHFGKDDANNIAKVVQRMIGDGCVFFITGRECDMWHKRSGDEGQATLPSPRQDEEGEVEDEDDGAA